MSTIHDAHFGAHHASLDTHFAHLEAHQRAHANAAHTYAFSNTDYGGYANSGFNNRTAFASNRVYAGMQGATFGAIFMSTLPPPEGTVLSLDFSPDTDGFPMQYALPAALQDPQNTYLRTVEDLNTFIGRANAVIRSAMPPSWLRPALMVGTMSCFVGFGVFSFLTVQNLGGGFTVGVVLFFIMFGVVGILLPLVLARHYNSKLQESLRGFFEQENQRVASSFGFHWQHVFGAMHRNRQSLIGHRYSQFIMLSVHLIQHQRASISPPPQAPTSSAFAPSAPQFVPAAEVVSMSTFPDKQDTPMVVAQPYFP